MTVPGHDLKGELSRFARTADEHAGGRKHDAVRQFAAAYRLHVICPTPPVTCSGCMTYWSSDTDFNG